MDLLQKEKLRMYLTCTGTEGKDDEEFYYFDITVDNKSVSLDVSFYINYETGEFGWYDMKLKNISFVSDVYSLLLWLRQISHLVYKQIIAAKNKKLNLIKTTWTLQISVSLG